MGGIGVKFDLPLEELKKYRGTNEKPADFNQYWDRSLAELDALSLDYELVPAPFTSRAADCYDLYFEGAGGAKVHCQLVKPKGQQGKGPGLLLFHGYHGSSGDWSQKIGYAAEGYTVLALDCRGQGGESEDHLQVRGTTLKGHIIRGIDEEDPMELYYRYVYLDTVQAARILMSMEHVDEDRIGAYGASQGGALTIACAALEPRVKLAAAVYPFLSDFRRAWDLDITSSAYEEIHYYFKFRDPLHKKEEEVFRKLGYIDIQHLADRVKGKVLWAVGMEDAICPPSTQFAAYNKIKSPKELLVYYEYGHEHIRTLSDRVHDFFTDL